MANLGTCKECGRTINKPFPDGPDLYCSDGCRRKARAAKQAAQTAGFAESSENIGRAIKLVGIALIALATLLVVLCYKFPKFLAQKNKKFLYAYIILWAALLVSGTVYFLIIRPNAPIKVEIVSATCETQERFVSILKEAGISGTVIEGEEFTTYSRQARDAVKERNKYATFKDSVYFVRLPDSVNVYIWFETENQTTAYIYKTE
jgi:hypothetical protein